MDNMPLIPDVLTYKDFPLTISEESDGPVQLVRLQHVPSYFPDVMLH